MPTVLEQELKAYDAHRDELLGAALGKYVLVHGGQLSGIFESRQDAIEAGYKQFGNVPFLVKQVLEVEAPLNFTSTLINA